MALGGFYLYAVFREVAGAHLACAAVGLALLMGGALWLLPNVVRDLSQLLFFNANPYFIRFVCLVGGAVGTLFLWVVLRRHVAWLQ